MVSKDSIVQWMDIKSASVSTDKISKLFGSYIDLAENTEAGMVIVFPDKQVLCTEWKGWTQVYKISRKSDISDWIDIRTKHGKVLRATPDTLIPTYDPTKISRGFHGETKYATIIKPLCEIKPGDIVRVLHAYDDDGSGLVLIHFDTIESVTPIRLSNPETGYSLVTRFKLVNCNDIYICARESDDTDSL
jgi:hypothetical protein